MMDKSDFLSDATTHIKTAFYEAEHDRPADGQAYALLAIASALVALVERLDAVITNTGDEHQRRALRIVPFRTEEL